MKKKLTIKEKLFCRFFAATGNLRESATKSGYDNCPEKNAVDLIERTEITDEIVKSKKYFQIDKEDILNGYRRIAFGSITDCVKLLFLENESDINQLEKMDLFSISEIKRPRDGSLEIKFFNRLEALEKLSELTANDSNCAAPFYQALQKSALNLD